MTPLTRESGLMLGKQEWSRTPRKNEYKDKGFHLIVFDITEKMKDSTNNGEKCYIPI